MMNPNSHSRWSIATYTESYKHSGSERMERNRKVGTKWETSIISKNHPRDFFSVPSIMIYMLCFHNLKAKDCSIRLYTERLETTFLRWFKGLISFKNTPVVIVILVMTQCSKFLASWAIPKCKKWKCCSSRKTLPAYRGRGSSGLFQQACSVLHLYESGKFPSVKKWFQEVTFQ